MPTVAPDSMSAAASCALMIFDFSRTHWIRSSLIGHPRCPSFAHEALGAARPVGGPPQQRRCNAIGRAWNDLKQTGGLEQGDPGRDSLDAFACYVRHWRHREAVPRSLFIRDAVA